MTFNDDSTAVAHVKSGRSEALLLTRFKSMEDLKAVVGIEYISAGSAGEGRGCAEVRLTHYGSVRSVTSVLSTGISQADFTDARKGNWWDRVKLATRSPYVAMHRNELLVIELLGRRRPLTYGIGDVAFYDLAETMVAHIREIDILAMPAEDLSEKGYLNSFNHITAQAFMTSMYSERLADFVADVHERYNMPELITGNFTAKQLADLETGPVDNYVDIINNEWGQELGKVLRSKYKINSKTIWTPSLMADYLNDILHYHSWVFQIGFTPFTPDDEVVKRFAGKINRVIEEAL